MEWILGKHARSQRGRQLQGVLIGLQGSYRVRSKHLKSNEAYSPIEMILCLVQWATFPERSGAECRFDFGAFEAPCPLLSRATPATAAIPAVWKSGWPTVR